MPTVQLTKAQLADLVRRGLIAPPAKGGRKKRAAAELVEASFAPPGTWVVPLRTASEVNRRDWRGRSRRTQDARLALSKAFGPRLRDLAPFADHYHAGGALRVAFTRLGGSRVDKSNLPTCTKGAEDFLSLLIGADDGDPRWRPSWGQEPGGPLGVRIELSAEGA